LLIYFAIQKRWKVAMTGLASFASATLITDAVIGTRAYGEYLTLGRGELERWYGHVSNASLTGFMMKLTGLLGSAGTWMTQPLIVICECATLVLLVGIVVRRTGDLDLEYAATTTAMLLLSPLSWSVYFVLLLLPLGLWCNRLGRTERASRYFLQLAAVWVLMSVPQDGVRMNLQAQGAAWHHTLAGHLLLDNLNFFGLAAFFLLQVRWLSATPARAKTSLPYAPIAV
jgi:hypothetical protein